MKEAVRPHTPFVRPGPWVALTGPVLLLAPCLAIYLIFFVWPQISLLGLGFHDPAGAITTRHYNRFLGDTYYWELLSRTLVLGVSVTSLTLLFGVPVAYVLARMTSRTASLLLIMTTFPLLVSAVVRSFGWMVLLFRDGLISDVIVWLDLSENPVQLMYTLTGTVIALAQVLLPLMVLSLYGVFRSIHPDLERAAMSLGAGPATAWFLITLRMATGGIVAGSLLVFSLAISTFATPSLVGGPRAHVMATSIYDLTIELLDWPFAAVQATILLVFVLAIAIVYARLVERGGQREARL